MSIFKNPINDKQMRSNSRTANKIIQIASEAQKAINNSPVGSVRFIGEGDPYKIKNAQEGDVIIDSGGDIYLWYHGKWEIAGNEKYDFSLYSGGRTNGKTMKTAAMQAAKARVTKVSDDVNLFANWQLLTQKASAALERNKGIKIFCSESRIHRDPIAAYIITDSADMTIECTLRPYTIRGEDIEYGKGTAEVTFRGSDFEDGSYIDKEIYIPPTLSKEDKYVLRIAYAFKQVDKFLKGQGDINNPPKFGLRVHYEY